jgi:hypothetical protein
MPRAKDKVISMKDKCPSFVLSPLCFVLAPEVLHG